MPIPSFPTGTPYSVEPCDCCTLGNPAAIRPRPNDVQFYPPPHGIVNMIADPLLVILMMEEFVDDFVGTGNGPTWSFPGDGDGGGGPNTPGVNTSPTGPTLRELFFTEVLPH